MDDRDKRIEALGAEVERLRARLQEEGELSKEEGKAAAVSELVDLVDDCDRAIEILADQPSLQEGLRGSQKRIIARFENLGFTILGEEGDEFDPDFHEAIDVVSGPEGEIVAVHRRGWLAANGSVVRAAMVTVGKGGMSDERS